MVPRGSGTGSEPGQLGGIGIGGQGTPNRCQVSAAPLFLPSQKQLLPWEEAPNLCWPWAPEQTISPTHSSWHSPTHQGGSVDLGSGARWPWVRIPALAHPLHGPLNFSGSQPITGDTKTHTPLAWSDNGTRCTGGLAPGPAHSRCKKVGAPLSSSQPNANSTLSFPGPLPWDPLGLHPVLPCRPHMPEPEGVLSLTGGRAEPGGVQWPGQAAPPR